MAGRMRSDDGSSFLNFRPKSHGDAVTQLLTALNHRYRALIGLDCQPVSHILHHFLDSPACAMRISHVAFACMMMVTMIDAIPRAR